jgi:hypothetical protein
MKKRFERNKNSKLSLSREATLLYGCFFIAEGVA